MKSIVSTYHGFHALPKGVKQLLLTSETLFFEDAKAASLAPIFQPLGAGLVAAQSGIESRKPANAPSPR